MTDKHKKQLKIIFVCMAAGVPIVLAAWVLVSTLTSLDLVLTCRLAGTSALLLLVSCILAPLFLPQASPARFRGFLVYWFVASLAFDLAWQIPNDLVPAIRNAPVVRENLWWAIVWWSYSLSDTHYAEVTPFMLVTEVWWFLGNIPGAVGLYMMSKGRNLLAYLLMGLCGALQAYNASMYIASNFYVDHFENIPPHPLCFVLYWGFNGFWTLAAAVACVLSFRLLLAQARV